MTTSEAREALAESLTQSLFGRGFWALGPNDRDNVLKAIDSLPAVTFDQECETCSGTGRDWIQSTNGLGHTSRYAGFGRCPDCTDGTRSVPALAAFVVEAGLAAPDVESVECEFCERDVLSHGTFQVCAQCYNAVAHPAAALPEEQKEAGDG